MKNSNLIFFLLPLVFLLLSSCEFSKGTEHFKDIPSEALLQITTYDGSGQITHPDILYFENEEGKSKFYLSFTPYPYGHLEYENPCILESDNGYEFYEAKNNLNPLISPVSLPGYNNDPDLFFDKSSQKFYLFYQETQPADSQNIKMISSTDAVFWSTPKTMIHQDFHNNDNFSLSPALIKKDSIYHMFFVNITGKREIKQLTSSNIEEWDYDKQTKISINSPQNFKPWHIDVSKGDDDTYYMLITGYEKHKEYQDLYLATSNNLNDWHFIKKPIIKHSKSFYNSRSTYRSTAIIKGNTMVVWFAIKSYDSAWHIGVKKFNLDEIR